jgi:predicted ferric reductase
MNFLFRDVLWWTLGAAALAVLAIRFMELFWTKLRHVSAMGTDPQDRQAYWRTSQPGWMPGLKKNVTYAPLWKNRHNRELRLSSAINVGTLPSRLHFIVIMAYLASNVAYMVVLNWSIENKYSLCAELRGRSGTLAVVNMVPLIILAGRNNPLIWMLKISFDTYNLLHRWLGRIVVAETVIHAIAWSIPAVADKGWDGILKNLLGSAFLGSGAIGTIALVLLLIASLSPLRHAFYETFLNLHILLALVIFVSTWVHCATASIPSGLPQLPWIMAIMALWFADRFARFFRLAYNNWSRKGFTEAWCEAMVSKTKATRVTLILPRYLGHAYLRFSGIRSWESHPFSIAWVRHRERGDTLPYIEEKTYQRRLDKTNTTTEVSFIIGAQTGFTKELFDMAQKNPHGVWLRAALEGPYAGHHSLDSYGHLLLFAGATGITHQMSYLEHHVQGYIRGSVATRRITVVWVIREFECMPWVEPWMNQVLRLQGEKNLKLLKFMVFVTRPVNPRELTASSSCVEMFPGRPDIPLLVSREAERQVGAMAVTVCGPGALADDVRSAVRQVQGENVIDFIEESFTW